MTTSVMIERVAHAICRVQDQDDFEEMARVAIEAMRVPTPPMEDAVGQVYELTNSPEINATLRHGCGRVWRVMIDAALAEPVTQAELDEVKKEFP
jgi:hypothetical protein